MDFLNELDAITKESTADTLKRQSVKNGRILKQSEVKAVEAKLSGEKLNHISSIMRRPNFVKNPTKKPASSSGYRSRAGKFKNHNSFINNLFNHGRN